MDFEQTFALSIKSGNKNRLFDLKIDSYMANEPFVIDLSAYIQSDNICFNNITYPTPLIFSIFCKRPEIFDFLLQMGADLNKEVNGWKPVHYTILLKNPKILKMILERDPSQVKSLDRNGSSPLHLAVTSGDFGIVYQLLEKGAEINAKNPGGNTPLHFSVMNHDKLTIQALIAFGADKGIKNNNGETPDTIAKKKNNSLAIEILSLPAQPKSYIEAMFQSEKNDAVEPASIETGLDYKINEVEKRLSHIEEIIYQME